MRILQSVFQERKSCGFVPRYKKKIALQWHECLDMHTKHTFVYGKKKLTNIHPYGQAFHFFSEGSVDKYGRCQTELSFTRNNVQYDYSFEETYVSTNLRFYCLQFTSFNHLPGNPCLTTPTESV